MPCRIGDDAAIVDKAGGTALIDSTVTLHGDATAHLQGLSRDTITRVKSATIAVDGRRSLARNMLGTRAAEVPAAIVLVDTDAVGQGQVVVDTEITIDIEVAAEGHSVEYGGAVVVIGCQRRTIGAHQCAVPDGAIQCACTSQRGGATAVVDGSENRIAAGGAESDIERVPG